MHALEGAVAAAFGEDADEIDDPIRTRDRARDRSLIGDIGRDRNDVPDTAHDFQVERLIGAAHGDADRMALFGQAAHHVASDESGTAEHRHQLAGNTRHDPSPLALGLTKDALLRQGPVCGQVYQTGS